MRRTSFQPASSFHIAFTPSLVELADARGALEAEAKKDKALFCAGVKQTYRAMYRKLLAAAD